MCGCVGWVGGNNPCSFVGTCPSPGKLQLLLLKLNELTLLIE